VDAADSATAGALVRMQMCILLAVPLMNTTGEALATTALPLDAPLPWRMSSSCGSAVGLYAVRYTQKLIE
jgi:hypothetical protein